MEVNNPHTTIDWTQVALPEGERNLPVYLLLDTSHSMAGEPIEALKQGLTLLQKELAADAETAQIVKLGTVVFNSTAELSDDRLTTITEFQAPELAACGCTRLDLAFDKLAESITRDVASPVKFGRKGDWKPVVFVLTDGCPTNEEGHADSERWIAAKERVLHSAKGIMKPAMIVAVGCGAKVSDETLKEIGTGPAFRIGTEMNSFAAFFQFVSASIRATVQRSMSLGQQPAQMAEPPVSVCIQKVI